MVLANASWGHSSVLDISTPWVILELHGEEGSKGDEQAHGDEKSPGCRAKKSYRGGVLTSWKEGLWAHVSSRCRSLGHD